MMLSTIKLRCPKAWQEFKTWYYRIADLPVHRKGFKSYPHAFQVGCFYQFFDENKLFVHIDHDTNRNGYIWWYWRLWGKWKRGITNQVEAEDFDTKHKSRVLAESAALTKAFEILEERL